MFSDCKVPQKSGTSSCSVPSENLGTSSSFSFSLKKGTSSRSRSLKSSFFVNCDSYLILYSFEAFIF